MSTPRDPDEYGDRLRDVLRAEADQVIPGGDGLMRIRERIDERRARSRWMVPLAAAASAAVVAGGIIGGIALTRDDDKATITPFAPPPSSSGSPAPAPSSTGTAPSTQTVTVPVYYLHDTGTAIRLYREFHRASVPASNPDPLIAAVDQMLHTPATDPDYTSLWPKTAQVLNADRAEGVASIDFSKDVQGQFNGGGEAAAQSIQQLVWTVTATDHLVSKVRILVEGKPVSDLFGVDVSKEQRRGPSYEVLGAVWVLAPTYNQSLHNPITVSGQATVFEGTVSIDILKGSTVVKSATAQATMGGPGRGDWKLVLTNLTLPPGSYVVRAYEASAKDGSVTNLDSKPFTLR